MPRVTTLYYEQGREFIPSPAGAKKSLVSGTTITLDTTISSSDAYTELGLTQTFSSTGSQFKLISTPISSQLAGSATSTSVLPTSNVTSTINFPFLSSSTLGKKSPSSSRVSSSRSQTVDLPSQSLSSTTTSASIFTPPNSSFIDTSTNTIPQISFRPYSPPCVAEQSSGLSTETVVINPVSSFIPSPMPSSSSAPLQFSANTISPSSTTSVVLSSNNPDNRTSFSSNTGAIIGVALAGGITLTVVAILTFLACRRMRGRKLSENGSSNDHLADTTPPLARSGSLRSPIDGDDEFLSGPYSGILAAMQFPVSNVHHGALEDGSAPNGDDSETLHSQDGSTSSHNRPPDISQMKQKGRGTVVFPMIEASASCSGFGMPTSPTPPTTPPTNDSVEMYPLSTTYRDKGKWKATEGPDDRPSLMKRLRRGPSREKNEQPESLASWISYYSNPLRSPSLLNPPVPVLNQPSVSHNITIDVERPPPMPWLNRPVSGSVKSEEAGSLAPSTRSRDDSLTRVPDGLLHPLLARRLELSPVGSARSFLDNVDYSRPISGVHWHARVDSTTTFTTQGTGEAELGHA